MAPSRTHTRQCVERALNILAGMIAKRSPEDAAVLAPMYDGLAAMNKGYIAKILYGTSFEQKGWLSRFRQRIHKRMQRAAKARRNGNARPALEASPAKSLELRRLERARTLLAQILAGDDREDAEAIEPIFARLEKELAEWDDDIQSRAKRRLAEVKPDLPRPRRSKRKPWHTMGQKPAVYFFQAGDFIKIGKSTGWNDRLAAMQTASPHPITPLLVLPADAHTERRLHERFKKDQVAGEWFRPSGDILAYVARRKPECLASRSRRQ